jgi:glucosamine-6-phosphate deaminase
MAEQLTADLLIKAIQEKPDIVLGLATGRTMEELYALLVAAHRDGGLDFSRVTTFNLDEYIGLEPGSRYSYRAYMNEHLFNKVNIDLTNTHLPDGSAADLDAASAYYEELITQAGGIDLQLLGIGRSGHIGFNEPLSAMYSRTRPKALTPTTVAQNAPLFPSPDMMPRRALTMGVGTILDARRCLMLVVGEEKAQILAKAVEGPVTSMISATALQLHPKCTVICDEDAAAHLSHREYYRWIFDNEPEWQEHH